MKHHVKKVGHALREATLKHRILAAIAIALIWGIVYYWFKYESAARVVEVFGLAPFADRALGALLGEA